MRFRVEKFGTATLIHGDALDVLLMLTGRWLMFYSGATAGASSARFHLLVDGGAETGVDGVGSDLVWARYHNDGSWWDNLLVFSRLTGIGWFAYSPNAPTPATDDNSTKLATTQYVRNVLTTYVSKTVDTALAAGYSASLVDDGVMSGGTYLPTFAGGNMHKITNGGAFTIAAPTAAGNYTLVLKIVNNTSAGLVSFSGFTKIYGDNLTTTNGAKFLLYVTKIDGDILLQKVAL